MGIHDDFRKFGRDASQESITLEAEYNFINTQKKGSCFTLYTENENDPLSQGVTLAVTEKPRSLTL